MEAVAQQRTLEGIAPACAALSLSRPTFYRRQEPKVEGARPVSRALPLLERKMVLSLLNDDWFADLAPVQVYATLLDEGTFRCSIPPMHWILQENRAVR